jgi:hypothetical protein
MIVVLCRPRLGVQVALALAEHDLDHRRGSILVRHGKQLRGGADGDPGVTVGDQVLGGRPPEPIGGTGDEDARHLLGRDYRAE